MQHRYSNYVVDVELMYPTLGINLKLKETTYEAAVETLSDIADSYRDHKEFISFLSESAGPLIVEAALEKDRFGFSGRSDGKGNSFHASIYSKRIKGEAQTCGRRKYEGIHEQAENIDTWDLIGEDRVCSFCGSLHPEDFKKICELVIETKGEKAEVEGSTKGYKFYAKRTGVKNAGMGGIKFYTHHVMGRDNDTFINELTLKLRTAQHISNERFKRRMKERFEDTGDKATRY